MNFIQKNDSANVEYPQSKKVELIQLLDVLIKKIENSF
jgi:hypothetical protein